MLTNHPAHVSWTNAAWLVEIEGDVIIT
jgi:hypothetical protein